MNTDNKVPATPRANQRRVRSIIIHRPMQREFSFMLIALFMVASAAIAWVIHQTIRDAAFGGGFYFGKVNPFQILSDVSYQIIVRVSLVLIFTLILIGSYGITFLHRVAGPVYRIRQTLLKLNRGEFPPDINLREGDFFHEVAQDINVVTRRRRLECDKIAELKLKLDEIQGAVTSDESRKKVEEMKTVLSELSKV